MMTWGRNQIRMKKRSQRSEAPWAEILQDCLFVRAVGRATRCVEELYPAYLATQSMYGWSMDRMARDPTGDHI